MNSVKQIIDDFLLACQEKNTSRGKGVGRNLDDSFLDFVEKFLFGLCVHNRIEPLLFNYNISKKTIDELYGYSALKYFFQERDKKQNGYINVNWIKKCTQKDIVHFLPLFKDASAGACKLKQGNEIKNAIEHYDLDIDPELFRFYNLVFILFIAYQIHPDESIFFMSQKVAFEIYLNQMENQNKIEPFHEGYPTFLTNYFHLLSEDAIKEYYTTNLFIFQETPYHKYVSKLLAIALKECNNHPPEFSRQYGIRLHSQHLQDTVRNCLYPNDLPQESKYLSYSGDYSLSSKQLNIPRKSITIILRPISEIAKKIVNTYQEQISNNSKAVSNEEIIIDLDAYTNEGKFKTYSKDDNPLKNNFSWLKRSKMDDFEYQELLKREIESSFYSLCSYLYIPTCEKSDKWLQNKICYDFLFALNIMYHKPPKELSNDLKRRGYQVGNIGRVRKRISEESSHWDKFLKEHYNGIKIKYQNYPPIIWSLISLLDKDNEIYEAVNKSIKNLKDYLENK